MASARSEICLGADIGTNNSCIVVLTDDSLPLVVKSREGDNGTPSAIFYPETSDGEILVGKAAMAKAPHANIIVQPKRGFGISLDTARKSNLLHTFNAEVSTAPVYQQETAKKRGGGRGGGGRSNAPKIIPETKVGVRFRIQQDGQVKEIAAETVVRDLIMKILEPIHAVYGKEISAVFSRPQYWDAHRTEMFKSTVEEALGPEGNLVAIITEPNAAQFSYQAQDGETGDKKRVFVIDLGGGTFDLSYLAQTAPGVYQGVITGGSDSLGGANIERDFLKALETEIKLDPTFNEEVFNEQKPAILIQLKELKHSLSLVDSARQVIYGCTTKPFTFVIDKEKKAAILKNFYGEIDKCIDKCFTMKAKELKESGKTVKELKESVERVYLVGGAMRDNSLTVEFFKKKFPKADIIGKPGTKGALNLEEVVGRGNALWCAAKRKVQTRISLPPNPVHLDILNKSIGVEGVQLGSDGYYVSKFCQIIPAFTEIPTCQVRKGFPTSQDNQDSVLIKVLQGDGEFTDGPEMSLVGEYSVPLKTPNKMDEVSVDIEIEVSNEGEMFVRAGQPGNLQQMKFEFHN